MKERFLHNWIYEPIITSYILKREICHPWISLSEIYICSTSGAYKVTRCMWWYLSTTAFHIQRNVTAYMYTIFIQQLWFYMYMTFSKFSHIKWQSVEFHNFGTKQTIKKGKMSRWSDTLLFKSVKVLLFLFCFYSQVTFKMGQGHQLW